MGNASGVFQADAVRVFSIARLLRPRCKLARRAIAQATVGPLLVVVLCANRRSFSARQTGSETNSPASIRRAASRESSPPARSASACRAGYAPTQSAAPDTRPENAGSSAPGRCHSESTAACLAAPRSPPAPASPVGWQSWYPLPAPGTLA